MSSSTIFYELHRLSKRITLYCCPYNKEDVSNEDFYKSFESFRNDLIPISSLFAPQPPPSSSTNNKTKTTNNNKVTATSKNKRKK